MKLSDYKQIKIRDFTNRYSKYQWQLIREHMSGSMYRLNSPTADCYTFIIDRPECPNDWQGGWDWTSGMVDPLEYLYSFKDKKLYQLKIR